MGTVRVRIEPERMTNIDLPHAHDSRCWWDHEQARWVCQGDRMPLTDVRDMLVVHTALLREFRLAPQAVRRTPATDRKQAARVAGHLRLLCDLLHHHHHGEDTLLWPKLRERVPGTAAGVFDDVAAQHERLDGAVSGVVDLIAGWTADPSSGERLAASLTELHVLLRDHLDIEERAVLPLAAMAITASEWHAVGEAAVAATPKPVLPLVFGMFAYEGDPAVLAGMLKAAPLVPRKVLPRIAPRIYARRARRLYGTTAP
jgi:hemerythrin-like domain-containing protein